MSDVAVRPLRAADRAQWTSLWRAYCDFYRAALPDDVTEATFAALCEAGELAGFVAVDDAGSLVGFAHLVFHRSTWSRATRCYLEDLFVAPHARGGGAARGLIEAAYAAVDARGADRVYWHTQEYNAPARSLYDSVAHRTSFIVYRR